MPATIRTKIEIARDALNYAARCLDAPLTEDTDDGAKDARNAVALIEADILPAYDAMLAALQLVHANAAESAEWLRARIAPAIAKAGGK